MQQALHLLQLPVLDLAAWLTTKVEENPALDYDETPSEEAEEGDELPSLTATLAQLDDNFTAALFPEFWNEGKSTDYVARAPLPSLCDLLMAQAREQFTSPEDLREAERIIGNLDERGLCTGPAEERILRTVQTFDPPGIAARSTRESLLLQLERKGRQNSPLYEQLKKFSIEEMIRNLSPEMIRELRQLAFAPVQGVAGEPPPMCVADLSIYQRGEEWHVVVNGGVLPRLRLSPPRGTLTSSHDKRMVAQFVAEGKSILRALEKRSSTLQAIGHYLLTRQPRFFQGRPEKLSPLSLGEMASELGFHLSTVARATAGKIVATPLGFFPLRQFFAPALATTRGIKISRWSVQEKIRSLTERASSLSDAQMAEILRGSGILCARRTVAKYRKGLKIPTARRRKGISGTSKAKRAFS
jgi:RNA polymerase sigma-54 factor